MSMIPTIGPDQRVLARDKTPLPRRHLRPHRYAGRCGRDCGADQARSGPNDGIGAGTAELFGAIGSRYWVGTKPGTSAKREHKALPQAAEQCLEETRA